MIDATRIAALAIVTAVVGAPPNTTAVDSPDGRMAIEYMTFPAAIHIAAFGCLNCENVQCIEGKHAASTPAPPQLAFGPGDGTHTLCNPGTCLDVHGICTGFATEVRDRHPVLANAAGVRQAVEIALSSQAFDIVRDLTVGAEDRVVLNRLRQSVQVLDCMGRYVANHSLSESEFDALVSLLE